MPRRLSNAGMRWPGRPTIECRPGRREPQGAIAALAALALAGPAHAAAFADDGSTATWRLLGPAAALHFGNEAAVVQTKASHVVLCYDATQIEPGLFMSRVPRPALELVSRTFDGQYVYRSDAARLPLECIEKFKPERRAGFRQTNPAIGLEYEVRGPDHADKAFATLVRDSYDTPSVMAGAARVWPLATLAGVTIDAGVSGGLWARSVLNRHRDGVERRTVPFVLPVLSMQDPRTGFGINAAFAPRMRLNGRHINRTPALMMQSTFRLGTREQVARSVDLGLTPDGHVRLGIAARY